MQSPNDPVAALVLPRQHSRFHSQIRWSLLALVLVIGALAWYSRLPIEQPARTAPPAGTIAIDPSGCGPARLDVAAIRATQLPVENRAAEAMVLTIPSLDLLINLVPGERGVIELPALPSGAYAFACLGADTHAQMMSSMRGGFVCGLDLDAVRQRALGIGAIIVSGTPATSARPSRYRTA
jgi:hypothetical protein